MRQLLPAVLVLLVVTGTVATGTPVGPPSSDVDAPRAATAPVQSLPNTTGYLAIEADDRETARFGNATVDVGGAAAMDAGRLEDQFLETTAIESFGAAETDTERTRAVERAVTTLENRTAALERRQARAVQRYNDGTISAEAFLRELAVVDARAREIDATVDRLLAATDRQSGYSLPIELRTRLENLRATPSVLRGPVRESAARAVAGQTGEAVVYAETSADGIVLARQSGDRYVREAYLGDAHGPGSDGQFTINDAYDRARTLYPWADDNRITTPSADGFGDTAVYRITIDHQHGRLVTFIDGGTTDAFREIQEKRLEPLPVSDSATAATDGLSLRVNASHATGPMTVTVRDEETGDPLSTRVTVNGQFAGRTGTDGRLRTVQPSGSVVVNATTDDGRSVRTTVFDQS